MEAAEAEAAKPVSKRPKTLGDDRAQQKRDLELACFVDRCEAKLSRPARACRAARRGRERWSVHDG
jgi:hypothetical protein